METWNLSETKDRATIRRRRSELLRIALSIPLFAACLFLARIGLYHTAVLGELLLPIGLLVCLIIWLYAPKGMEWKLGVGCALCLALLPILAPLAFRPYTRAQSVRTYVLRDGTTGIKLSTCGIATKWEIIDATSQNAVDGPSDRVSLISPDRKSVIDLRVSTGKGSAGDYDFAAWMKSGADFIRDGNEAVHRATFHGMPALTMSHTGAVGDSYRLNALPATELVVVDKTVVCWSDGTDSHRMFVVTAYPAGDKTAKSRIDQILASVQLYR